MKDNKKYIIYGAFTIILLFVSYWGINYLKGSTLFKNTYSYYVIYEDINGLENSSAVMINGYKVGTVTHIKFLPQDNCKLLVKLDISKDFLLPQSTLANIGNLDLLGTKFIDLKFSDKDSFHSPGDTLMGHLDLGIKEQITEQITPLKIQTEELVENLKNLSNSINSILDENTIGNIQESLSNIKNTTANFHSFSNNLDKLVTNNSDNLNKLLLNAKDISDILEKNKDNLDNTFANLRTFSDTLVAIDITNTFTQASKSLENLNTILQKVNDGEGSLGALVNRNNLATDLEESANNLKLLLEDVKNNPKRYVNFSLIRF